jgi:hypothetical protein
MGGVFWKGGSQEVVRPMAIAQLKMEDVCILCNVIKNFYEKKVIKIERWEPSKVLLEPKFEITCDISSPKL